MSHADLAAFALSQLTSRSSLQSYRDQLHELIRIKLTANPVHGELWNKFEQDERPPEELYGALEQALSHDPRFAASVREAAEKAHWRGRVLPRRDVLLAVGGGLAGAFFGGVATWLLNPKIEPIAQERVNEANRALAESKGVLAFKSAVQDHTGDAFGWAFREKLSPTQVDNLLSARGRANLGLSAESARPVQIAYHYWGELFNFTRLRVTVVNNWPKPVLITDIRAKVTRSAPLSGALVFAGAQGGVDVIDIGFDLEEDAPRARVSVEEGKLGEPWAYDQNVELEPGQTQPFNMIGRATASCCEWQIEVEAEVDGERRTFTVNDVDKPFITTAFADHYQQRFSYKLDSGLWVDRGPGGMFS